MDVYMGRQPIFNQRCKVVGYELLYRDAEHKDHAHIVSQEVATTRVLSDAITVFGLTNLTDNKYAFVNFPEKLILNDFVLLAKPDNVVVELLETVRITEGLLEKLRVLKQKGYYIALDDYTGEVRFDPLLPLVDVVKVDFRMTKPLQQKEIAEKLHSKYKKMALLAEKIEDAAEFEWAKQQGYGMFQGYFFAKPTTVNKHISESGTALLEMMAELNREEPNYVQCAEIIQRDPTLSYRFIHHLKRLAAFRGNLASSIQHNLVMVGVQELRRWVTLALAFENNVSTTSELVRVAYLRGVFACKLMRCDVHSEDSNWGLMLGMFSMMEHILNIDIRKLLWDVAMPQEIALALTNEDENYYTKLLRYVMNYEQHYGQLNLDTAEHNADYARMKADIGVKLTDREIVHLYMDSITETDRIFKLMEGAQS
jgi:EAL and modified HD-GYP domain-containing signal transduction protein